MIDKYSLIHSNRYHISLKEAFHELLSSKDPVSEEGIHPSTNQDPNLSRKLCYSIRYSYQQDMRLRFNMYQ